MVLIKAVLVSLIGLFLMASFFLLGCGGSIGGTETGNATAISLRVIGYQSTQFQSPLTTLTVNGLEVTTARVVLDRIRFRPFSGCQNNASDDSSEEEVEFNGPFVIDLLDPMAVSGLENLIVPTGRYCRVELTFKKLELPEGVDSDDPIVNRSILIEGNRFDGTSFQLVTEQDEKFRLENETTGFLITSSSEVAVLFIAFDLDQWFQGIDLSNPSVQISKDESGHPIILINDVSNEKLQETIEDNIKLSAALFEDEDEDEDLDPAEEEDSLAAGESVP
jgi:hypothetical protein